MSGTTTQVGIVEWAERIESARALELQLAGVIGAWVPRVVPAGAKLLLARHARHFASRARRWSTPRSRAPKPHWLQ
jgi:hypothetical protein